MGSNAPFSPENQLYAQVDWQLEGSTFFNVQANWVMDRNREAYDPRQEIDDYITVDLTLRQENIWKNISAALMIKNVFDEDAREPAPGGYPIAPIPFDLPLPGRSILGEVSITF